MQCINNCTPETKHVSRVRTVAAALYSHFTPHVMFFHVKHVMYFYTSTIGK
jgi:hypothetical protein